jgi:hypothetical protein
VTIGVEDIIVIEKTGGFNQTLARMSSIYSPFGRCNLFFPSVSNILECVKW